MLVGATGTGKTVLAQSLLRDLPETHSQLVLNFSAATTSSAVQDIGLLIAFNSISTFEFVKHISYLCSGRANGKALQRQAWSTRG